MWVKLYFLAAIWSVLQYEEIYFNVQFGNYKEKAGVFFSVLLGRRVHSLPLAEQRV